MSRTSTDYIVVHCSATPITSDIGASEIDAMHKARGWSRIGYHSVIRLDGTVESGRDLWAQGAHVKGYNARSVGVCVVGGVGVDGKPECTINPAQSDSLRALLSRWQLEFPTAEIVGHRDLSPDLDQDGEVTINEWLKACPSFDVKHWMDTGNAVFHVER